MGLEAGTFIADLVASNPATSDLESQGANHLQLIKSVLQATFPGANRAFPFPVLSNKTTNFAPAKSEAGTIFVVGTDGGIVTLTLPTLTSADVGWKISVTKSSAGANPILIVPSSGSILSGPLTVSSARRCIPHTLFDCLWNGSVWFVGRCVQVPVGTILETFAPALPVGFEWANGQTLGSASTNYPEYNLAIGSGLTPDRQGRAGFGKGNMGGADVGRITVAGKNFDGTTLGGTQDNQNHTLTQAELPSANLALAGSPPNATSTAPFARADGGGTNTGSKFGASATVTQDTVSSSVSLSGVTATLGGSNTPHSILPPAIIMNYIVVTE